MSIESSEHQILDAFFLVQELTNWSLEIRLSIEAMGCEDAIRVTVCVRVPSETFLMIVQVPVIGLKCSHCQGLHVLYLYIQYVILRVYVFTIGIIFSY